MQRMLKMSKSVSQIFQKLNIYEENNKGMNNNIINNIIP